MQKILLPILSSILTFASFLPIAFAQTLNNDAIAPIQKSVTGKLTNRQWYKLNERYYQSRYRTKFTPNNSFLSLREVKRILGNEGSRRQVNKQSLFQHWYWQDSQNPRKRIKAIFVYHQLIGLTSRGFDSQQLQLIKTKVINQNNHKSP